MNYLIKFCNYVNENLLPEGLCDFLLIKIDDDFLIKRKWCRGFYTYLEQELKIFINESLTLPDGFYELKAIRFWDNSNRIILFLSNPYGFTSPYFLIENNFIKEAEKNNNLNELIEKSEKQLKIGESLNNSDILYREIHLICQDALISFPIKLGPSEIYPLSSNSNLDLANKIQESLIEMGIRYPDFGETLIFLEQFKERKSPIFLLSFKRIYRTKENIIETLFPYIQTIFGILAVNRLAYPKILGGIYIENRKDGTRFISPFNLNSYYRGNLVGGSLASEKPNEWNKQFNNIIKSEHKIEIVSKLNFAHSVLDLDLAYLQYWSILESIAFDIFNDKHINRIKEIIQLTFSDNIRNISLKIADLEFNFEQLLLMWQNRRDLTAHNGGISAYFSGKVKCLKDNKKFIDKMKELHIPLMYGEDMCLELLKETCTKAVLKYIRSEL